MAGDWIKVKTDLATDPAVIRLADELDVEEDVVVGKLCRLWSWANTHTENGHAPGVTSEWLDRYLDCHGFARILAAVGWLEVTDDGLEIPRFERHNGKSAKTRATARERKRRERGKTRADAHKSGADAQKSAPAGTQRNATQRRNGHADTVTKRAHTSDREEKRREEPPPLNPPTWSEVETALTGEGVFAAGPAVQAAQQIGASPAEIWAIIEHARSKPGAWGPGAIRHRVMHTRPGLDPSEGWPSESEEFERERQAFLEGEERRRSRARADAEKERNAETRRDDDQREATFGPILDGMGKEAQDKLARLCLGTGPVMTSYRQAGPTGMARQLMLAELEKREGGGG